MSVKQEVTFDKYNWKIYIYYIVNPSLRQEILKTLSDLECSKGIIDLIKRNLSNCAIDTGFTYSNYGAKFTLMVIHKASSIGEFVNTFEHEKNHLLMHICEAEDVNPYSEEAAHAMGELSQLILEQALCSIVAI